MERYEVVDGNTILGSGSYGRVDKVRRKRDLKGIQFLVHG